MAAEFILAGRAVTEGDCVSRVKTSKTSFPSPVTVSDTSSGKQELWLFVEVLRFLRRDFVDFRVVLPAFSVQTRNIVSPPDEFSAAI